MADFTSSGWLAGATVNAYARDAFGKATGAAVGNSPQVASSAGIVTFSGLADSGKYVATDGSRSVRFGTPPASAGSSSAVNAVNPVAANQTLALPSPGGGVFDITLTQNTTLAITGAQPGTQASVDLRLTQDGTGGRTVTWPAGMVWQGDVAPTLPSGAGATMLVTLVSFNGGTTWYGFYYSAAAGIEPWSIVGGGGALPAFQNSWANVGAPKMTMRFTKTATGLVLVQGAVVNTITGWNTVVFTLPAGYRPLTQVRHAAVAWDATGNTYRLANWQIDATGNVTAGIFPVSGAIPSEVYADFTFRAEQ
jgi:hypothetical protein